MHRVAEPAILYFGTPVVLVGSRNQDGSPNLAPISSAWWLGWNCMLGFGARSQTPQNLERERECVLNLPSVDQVTAVDRLARLTASDPVPEHKLRMGYRHEREKFAAAGLTADRADLVDAPRVRECPVQLEAVVTGLHRLEADDPSRRGSLVGIEVKIVRVHLEESILMEGHDDRVDPEKWRPLVMSFCQFFGLTGKIHRSRLAEIPESAYRPRAAGPASAASRSLTSTT
jgi:flavin reductase (DIM6/NTAB) family NADH-FMN oxidoreductase RutF